MNNKRKGLEFVLKIIKKEEQKVEHEVHHRLKYYLNQDFKIIKEEKNYLWLKKGSDLVDYDLRHNIAVEYFLSEIKK
jgi:hypothetical protein